MQVEQSVRVGGHKMHRLSGTSLSLLLWEDNQPTQRSQVFSGSPYARQVLAHVSPVPRQGAGQSHAREGDRPARCGRPGWGALEGLAQERDWSERERT
jgi:hypothetical protein